MSLDLLDLVIVGTIAGIVVYYAILRYREEKKKQEAVLIPTLESYREKFTREKQEFEKRAVAYQEKLSMLRHQLENLKNNMADYPWTESQISYLRQMKGSEFEYFLNTTFQMLGFEVIDPEYYKEFHIDSILKYEDENRKEYIIVDYVDFTQVKKIDEQYLRELQKGKEKYGISKVWIITNAGLDEETTKKIFEFDYNLLDTGYITRFLPSLNFFYEYEDLKSKFHATEILHKEMFDEIIRREHWLQEVEEKLVEALEKRNKL